MKLQRNRVVFAICIVTATTMICGLAWRQYRQWIRGQFELSCRTARNDVNWEAELDAATRWTVEFPDDADAWLFLCEAYAETDQFDKARETLLRIPDSDPRFIAAMLQKASLEWNELNLPDEAIATYHDLLKRNPQILEAHAHIIAYHAFRMDRAPMLAAIETAIEVGAEPRDAYSYLCLADRINVSNGRQILQRWMNPKVNDEALKISYAVRTAEQIAMTADVEVEQRAEEQEKEAIFRLEEFLSVHPHNLVLLGFLLDHYVEQGSIPDVSRLLALAPESAANDHKFWVCRGWYYTITEQFAEAESSFQQALKLHPLSAEARNHYSALLRLMNQPEEQIQQMQSLAAEGREIRKLVLQLKSSDAIDETLLRRVATYAELCGAGNVRQALAIRLSERPAANNR